MGGVIGLAIVTTASNGSVRSGLAQFLSGGQIDDLLRSAEAIPTFPPETQIAIKTVFADGYNLQMKILSGFAAAQIPSSMIMWQKKQIVV